MSNEPVRKGVSLNPDDFVQGGLVDDVDAVIKTARFVKWDYQGKTDPVLGLHLNFASKDGEEYDQYYSAGDLKRFAPSDDGKCAIPVGDAQALTISSNACQFLISVANAGFAKNKLGEDLSVLDGLGCHLRRVAQAERKGLKTEKKEGDRDKTILVVSEILWLPGETPKFVVGSGASVSKGAPAQTHAVAGGPPAGSVATVSATVQASAASASSSADIDSKAAGYILRVLSENGGTFQKSGLPSALFKLLSQDKDPDQSKILSIAFNPNWVTAADRPWKVDAAGVISLG